MAITGNGTSTTPYVVHDYWELKEVCNGNDYRMGDDDYIKYICLDNDIDCKSDEYADDFEWESIKCNGLVSKDGSSYINGYFDLDLKGHTIKTVMVKSSNYLFYGDKTGNNYEQGKIHNGKILNIYGNGAKTLFQRIDLEDLSISVNANNITYNVLGRCVTNRCAIYIEASKLNNTCIYYPVRGSSVEPPFRNTDFYFKITDVNNKAIFEQDTSTITIQIKSCRFRGEIHGDINSYINDVLNCVFDITCDNTNTLIAYSGSENENVLYNSDKMIAGAYSGIIAATTAEMKNATTLTNKGFLVVNKTGG